MVSSRREGACFGVIFLSSQLGGAIAPLLIVPIQVHFGWRVSFYIFGIPGVLWGRRLVALVSQSSRGEDRHH